MDSVNINNDLKDFLNEQLTKQLLSSASPKVFLPQSFATSQKLGQLFDVLSMYFGFLDPETFGQICQGIENAPRTFSASLSSIQQLHQYVIKNGFVSSEANTVTLHLSSSKKRPLFSNSLSIPITDSKGLKTATTEMLRVYNSLNVFSGIFYQTHRNLFQPSVPLPPVLLEHCSKRLFNIYLNHLSVETPRDALVACCANCYTVMACIQYYGQKAEDVFSKNIVEHLMGLNNKSNTDNQQHKVSNTVTHSIYSGIAVKTLLSEKQDWISLSPNQLRQKACRYASNAFLSSLDHNQKLVNNHQEYALWIAHCKTLYPSNLVCELFLAAATDTQAIQQFSDDILSHPLEQPVLKIVSATKACIKPFSIKHSASKNIEDFIQFLNATQLLKKIFSPLFQELDQHVTQDNIESLEAQTALRTFQFQSSVSTDPSKEPNHCVLPLLCAAQLLKFREHKNNSMEPPTQKIMCSMKDSMLFGKQ